MKDHNICLHHFPFVKKTLHEVQYYCPLVLQFSVCSVMVEPFLLHLATDCLMSTWNKSSSFATTESFAQSQGLIECSLQLGQSLFFILFLFVALYIFFENVLRCIPYLQKDLQTETFILYTVIYFRYSITEHYRAGCFTLKSFSHCSVGKRWKF